MSPFSVAIMNIIYIAIIAIGIPYGHHRFIFAFSAVFFLRFLTCAAAEDWGSAAYWLGWSFMFYFIQEKTRRAYEVD